MTQKKWYSYQLTYNLCPRAAFTWAVRTTLSLCSGEGGDPQSVWGSIACSLAHVIPPPPLFCTRALLPRCLGGRRRVHGSRRVHSFMPPELYSHVKRFPPLPCKSSRRTHTHTQNRKKMQPTPSKEGNWRQAPTRLPSTPVHSQTSKRIK